MKVYDREIDLQIMQEKLVSYRSCSYKFYCSIKINIHSLLNNPTAETKEQAQRQFEEEKKLSEETKVEVCALSTKLQEKENELQILRDKLVSCYSVPL